MQGRSLKSSRLLQPFTGFCGLVQQGLYFGALDGLCWVCALWLRTVDSGAWEKSTDHRAD